jgi:hypothetical protein
MFLVFGKLSAGHREDVRTYLAKTPLLVKVVTNQNSPHSDLTTLQDVVKPRVALFTIDVVSAKFILAELHSVGHASF